MMSFFPRSYCAPAAEASLTPLFRLLNDFDTYSREVSNTSPSPASRRHHHRRGPRSHLASFNPKFDVSETENTYELHGELPGLSRDNLDIQFTDAQTIAIRGRVERSYGPESESNNTAAAAAAEESNTTTTPTESSDPETEKPRRNSHQATVEDDPEDDTYSNISTPSETPKTEVAQPAVAETQVQTTTQQAAEQQTQTQPQERYWLWERSVGEFSRTFKFPGLVDHDGVSAALNNGILTVSVPKAKKPVARRIQISA